MKKLINYIWSTLLLLTKRVDYIPANTISFPNRGNMANNKIYIVGHQSLPKWVVMRCPCGCNEQLTLSLMSSHLPNWKVEAMNNRVTLSPSIWKTDGCKSHFFIRKGKVVWVKG